MWMMPLHLHVNQKSDYDDMMIHDNQHFNWEQKEKSVQNFRTFTVTVDTFGLLLYFQREIQP